MASLPSRKPRRKVSDFAWMALIATPQLVILGLMVVLFTWQARSGTVTPKWRKPKPGATNVTVPAQEPVGRGASDAVPSGTAEAR